MKWYPGWLAREFEINWVLFWFKNWSITPFLAFISWVWLFHQTKKANLTKPLLFAPFFTLFIAANLWLFQPFSWDNTKIIVWASLGFSGLIGHFLYQSWHAIKHHQLTVIGQKLTKLGLLCLFFVMTASGAIDAYYIVRHDLHSHIMFTREEVELAEWARSNTDNHTRWLTGDQHNHWLFVLTGRQALMTYRGWLWTHGYNYRPVEASVSQMFGNPQRNQALFEEYQVDYIVVGPNEESVWHANQAAFKQLFPIVKQTQNYTVFSTKQSLQ
jgi:hypothetical protein